MNALLEATEQQDAPRVRAMIEGAANANAVVDKVHPPRVPPCHGDWAKWDGWSALKLACYIGGSTGDLNIARLLLEAGASTELRLNKRGWAALMFFAGAPACGGANIPVVELLLDYGAEVNAVDDIGMTPLISAAYTGNAAMVDTLLARGANVDVKDTDGDSALVLAVGTDEESEDSDEAAAVIAVGAASGGTLEGVGEVPPPPAGAEEETLAHGHLDIARALLEAGADADSTDDRGFTVAKLAVLTKNVPMLELLLRYGASAATAIDPGPLDPENNDPGNGNPVDAETWNDLVLALVDETRLIPLLADYGGLSLDPRCGEAVVSTTKLVCAVDFHDGATNAHIAMLRRVGCDAWCDGGLCFRNLRTRHDVDGTALLGPELVGHAIQIRVRPLHLAAPLDPLTLVRGDRVVVRGLVSAAALHLNGKCGKVGGGLGAMKPGRYPVLLKGEGKTYKQVKPRNLRPTKDPGRAAVAGHEVDALHSVVVSGASGESAFLNNVYERDATRTRCTRLSGMGLEHDFPVFSHSNDPSQDWVLFCAPDGRWLIGCAAVLTSDTPGVFARTKYRSASPLGHQWGVSNADGSGIIQDAAVTATAHAWVGGAPPTDWVLRDATVVDFCEGSQEHKLVFTDAARTPLWARLDHFRFLDWSLLPLRRAALLRPRVVLVALMVLNRLAANRVPTEPPLTEHADAPPGTPVLRTCLRAALTVPLQHGMNLGAIFRESVWPHVLGAPDLKVVARAEHAAQTRRAASAATARAAMASGGGGGGSWDQLD
jgi:ankyrin repeat protein